MSHIEATGLLRRIGRTRDGLAPAVEKAVDGKVKEMQATAVQLVPKRTGNLAELLAGDDAIEKKRQGGKVSWRFGFLSAEAKRKGWYWRFVEFGTRGYEKGEQRRAGVDKHGRRRTQKVARRVPPRKAQPYLRPAMILFRQKLARLGVRGILEAALKK